MRKYTFLLLLVFALSKQGECTNKDSSYAHQLIKVSDSLNFIGQYNDALLIAKEALAIYKKNYSKNDVHLAKAYEQMGVASMRLWDLEKGMAYATRGVEILSLLEKQEIALTNHLNILALCYYYLGDYELANVYYDKISKLLYKKFNTYNHDQFIRTLSNQGGCYYYMNDFERANELFQKSLDITLENHGPNDERILGKYNNLGNVQMTIGNYDKALELFNKSLDVKLKLLPKDHSFLATTYNNLGECYAKKGVVQKALSYYKKTLQIYEKNNAGCSVDYIESHCSIGLIYKKEKKYAQALSIYQNALNRLKNCYEKAPPAMANIYSYLGELMLDLGETQGALRSFENAFAVLKFDPEKEASYKNRNTAVRILEIIERRIKLYDRIYTQSQNVNDLTKMLKDCEIAIEIIDFLRIQYLGNDAKLYILDTYYPIFAKAITICHTLWEKESNDLWLKKAFQLSEKSKSVVLLESLNKSNGILTAGIPDSLIQKERDLRFGISFYEKQIYNLEIKQEKESEKELIVFRNRVFDLKQSYAILINKFEIDYPEYFRLKYNRKIIEVEEIQQKILEKKEALIEYFIGEQYIFCFVIKTEKIEVFKIKKDFPLETWIENLRNNISTYPHRLLKGKDTKAKELADLSFKIYTKLFTRLDLNSITKIRIIPDGILGYLPFEVLLTKYPEQLSKYRSYAFLVKDLDISYSFSASLLQEELLNQSWSNKKNLIAFAPIFKGDKDSTSTSTVATKISGKRNFGNLKFNVKEVNLINDLIQSDLFIGNAASEANFIQEAMDYKIIHLATHAITNDQENNYSYLVFAAQKDSLENELLHVKDIYNLKLNADMVVLSACETAIGKLKKGEGIISLARGFSYAGAKSIVTTLWSVNDRKTAELMELFYQNIKAGLTKDRALRKAQINYIHQNRDQYSHPFFWAAFIPLGNMEAIHLSNDAMAKVGVIGICLLLIFLIARIFVEKRILKKQNLS